MPYKLVIGGAWIFTKYLNFYLYLFLDCNGSTTGGFRIHFLELIKQTSKSRANKPDVKQEIVIRANKPKNKIQRQ